MTGLRFRPCLMTMIDTDATCNAHDDDDEDDADDDDHDDDDDDEDDKLFPLQDLISKRCFRYLHPFPSKKVPSESTCALHLFLLPCSNCRRSLRHLCSLTGMS